MARDPLRAYRPTWLCRLLGHNNNARFAAWKTDYCVRCFLPTIPKLLEDLEEYRELVHQQRAITDLDNMLKGGKDATSRPSS